MIDRLQPTEAFDVGWHFYAFVHSSHCYDARDLTRFFMCDYLPEWVRHCLPVFERQHTPGMTKGEAIVVAKKIIYEQMERLS